MILLSIGFSVGTALLLAFAFTSTYRSLVLPVYSCHAGHQFLFKPVSDSC